LEHYCLDSYAILAFIGGEEGAEVVERALVEARAKRAEVYMSTVSLAEFYNVVSREEGVEVADRKYAELRMTSVIFDAPDEETALQAGRFKTKYSRMKASFALADAFCLATAYKYGARMITGDPDFSPVSECKIIWIAASTT